ncbi:hypothetical protein EJ08DRAFT_333211 [Tothia fuscella]|uniref:Uncharacterized protein n=1 Tax=Tothia fuscella TaxID=1048955 RepID=A0A9P4NN99_9PEZI|nr:hypothetical protein EJ08DRAFT_333211 [Tothia fuscella]
MVDAQARSLVYKIQVLTAKVSLLQAENEGLRRGIMIEKNRRKRGKALFDVIRAEGPSVALWMSPTKVQRCRDVMAEKEYEKVREAERKAEEKIEKQRIKDARVLEVIDNKRKRAEAKKLKDKEKAEQKAVRQEALEQRAVDKQLSNNLNLTVKRPQRATAVSTKSIRLVVKFKVVIINGRARLVPRHSLRTVRARS